MKHWHYKPTKTNRLFFQSQIMLSAERYNHHKQQTTMVKMYVEIINCFRLYVITQTLDSKHTYTISNGQLHGFYSKHSARVHHELHNYSHLSKEQISTKTELPLLPVTRVARLKNSHAPAHKHRHKNSLLSRWLKTFSSALNNLILQGMFKYYCPIYVRTT
jgi:ABC-type nickel/cobalt efflux system permease component RcnA